jgi:hypothetical protein
MDGCAFNELVDMHLTYGHSVAMAGELRASAKKHSHIDAIQTTKKLWPLIFDLLLEGLKN